MACKPIKKNEVIEDNIFSNLKLSAEQAQGAIVALQIELTKLNLEYAETGTRFLLNKINVLGAEVDKMLSGSSADIDDLIVYVIRTGYPIDEKAINTKVFYKLVDLCTTENRAKNGGQTNKKK